MILALCIKTLQCCCAKKGCCLSVSAVRAEKMWPIKQKDCDVSFVPTKLGLSGWTKCLQRLQDNYKGEE